LSGQRRVKSDSRGSLAIRNFGSSAFLSINNY
jgi:hypothetical protein